MSTTAEIAIVCGQVFKGPNDVNKLVAEYAVAHPHDAYCTMLGKGYIDDLKLVKRGEEPPEGYTKVTAVPDVRDVFNIYISRTMRLWWAVNLFAFSWSDFLNGRPYSVRRGDGIGVACDLDTKGSLSLYKDEKMVISMIPAGPLIDIGLRQVPTSYIPVGNGNATTFSTLTPLAEGPVLKTVLQYRFAASSDLAAAASNDHELRPFNFKTDVFDRIPITRLEMFNGTHPAITAWQTVEHYATERGAFHLIVTRGNGSPIVTVQVAFGVWSGDPHLDWIDFQPPPPLGRNHWCWLTPMNQKIILHTNPSDVRSITARQIQGHWYTGSSVVQMTGILFHSPCWFEGGAFSRSLPEELGQKGPLSEKEKKTEKADLWYMVGLTAFENHVGQFSFVWNSDTKHVTGHISNGSKNSETYTHATDTKTADNLRLYTTAGCISLNLAEPVTCTPVTVWVQDENLCSKCGFGVVFDESLAPSKVLPKLPNWIDVAQALYTWTNNEWKQGQSRSIRQGRMSATELHCINVYGAMADINRYPVTERFQVGVAYNRSEVWQDGTRVL